MLTANLKTLHKIPINTHKKRTSGPTEYIDDDITENNIQSSVHLEMTYKLTCTGQVCSAIHADGPAVQTDCTQGLAAR